MSYEKLAADVKSAQLEFARHHLDFMKAMQRFLESYSPELKASALTLVAATNELKSAVLADPESFTKPRSKNVHGIEFGYRLSRETCVFEVDDDDAFLIELIDKELPDKANMIAPPKREILLEPIKRLTDDERRKIGVTLVQTDNAYVRVDELEQFEQLKKTGVI